MLWIPTLHWISVLRMTLIAILVILTAKAVYKNSDFTGFPLMINLVLALEGSVILHGKELNMLQKSDLTNAIMIFFAGSFWVAAAVGLLGYLNIVRTKNKIA